MGLRIATNVASESVRANLSKVSQAADEQLTKLSSGKRINKSADDAAGLAIATNLGATIGGLKQARRNANDGIAMIQVAEGGLNEVTNILTRLRELSIQAGSDTIGDHERGLLNEEYTQLTDEVERIAQSTTFNGFKILAGDGSGTLDIHVGANADEVNRIQFDSDTGNATNDHLGIDGLTVESKDDALDAIESVDEALTSISSQRAILGSVQSRLQSSVNNLSVQVINQSNAKSVIQDTDVAEAVSDLAAGNVLKQSGIATLAQANNLPNSALRLIG